MRFNIGIQLGSSNQQFGIQLIIEKLKEFLKSHLKNETTNSFIDAYCDEASKVAHRCCSHDSVPTVDFNKLKTALDEKIRLQYKKKQTSPSFETREKAKTDIFRQLSHILR